MTVSLRRLSLVLALHAGAACRDEGGETVAGPGVALLAGADLSQDRDAAVVERGRALLRGALADYQRGGHHADAARAAEYLSRAPRPEARFKDALDYATIAVDEAHLSKNATATGRALTALAEVYDDIGMVHEAKDAFFRAEENLRGDPGRLAFAYMKHGIFLVDQESAQARRAGLAYLRTARTIVRESRQVSAGIRDTVEYAVQLNAAPAYADLGDRAAAEAELVAEPIGDDQRRTMSLTRGFLAARGDRIEEAVQLFAAARPADYGLDSSLWAALELARACRRAGRMEDAERYFRDAIAHVEDLRDDGAHSLRPLVMARRASAYTELVALLAGQQRGLAALVVAESLHARTWLDAVLGSGADRLLSVDQGVREAEVRSRQPAQPALDAEALLARLGDREALLLLQAGTGFWRVHVVGRRVTITPIADADRDAIIAFRDHPDNRAAAARAARALLPDALAARTDPLHVVANGDLAALPFAALPFGGAPLVHHRAVVRVPGLAALGCRSRPWTSTQRFVGDSTEDLPHAAAEVMRLGGSDAVIGARATRASILEAKDIDLLHVAVHGRDTATGGALQLADGRLTTTDIVDAAIGPRVVMLTGCATSISADAEAWTSFPSAFLASGSQHVIATVRSVPDDAAAILVAAYYREPSTLSPPERLAAAQRAVAATLKVEVWSAFAAWGDAECGR